MTVSNNSLSTGMEINLFFGVFLRYLTSPSFSTEGGLCAAFLFCQNIGSGEVTSHRKLQAGRSCAGGVALGSRPEYAVVRRPGHKLGSCFCCGLRMFLSCSPERCSIMQS